MQLPKQIEFDLNKQCSVIAAAFNPAIDKTAYASAERDPVLPILYDGNPNARIAIIGRDLGMQEVSRGVPLIGPSGSRVRAIIEQFYHDVSPQLMNAFLCNTVPYKPIGNKPFSKSFQEAMRPILLTLLTSVWTGDQVIPLGHDAWEWFRPYHKYGQIKTEERLYASFEAILPMPNGKSKSIILRPLPHPSPLNARYWKTFPDLLQKRLEEVKAVTIQA